MDRVQRGSDPWMGGYSGGSLRQIDQRSGGISKDTFGHSQRLTSDKRLLHGSKGGRRSDHGEGNREGKLHGCGVVKVVVVCEF